MTREEQIKKASLDERNYPNSDIEVDHISFQDGARWADNHPNWHKFPDEKPSIVDDYIVAFNDGNVFVAHFSTNLNKWRDIDGLNLFKEYSVIAWMEFPKPPKFD